MGLEDPEFSLKLKRRQLASCRELLGIYAGDCKMIREQFDQMREYEPTLIDEERQKWAAIADRMREMELKSAEYLQLERALKADVERLEAEALERQSRVLPKRDLRTQVD